MNLINSDEQQKSHKLLLPNINYLDQISIDNLNLLILYSLESLEYDTYGRDLIILIR